MKKKEESRGKERIRIQEFLWTWGKVIRIPGVRPRDPADIIEEATGFPVRLVWILEGEAVRNNLALPDARAPRTWPLVSINIPITASLEVLENALNPRD